jgi:hypothetical protein
MIFSPREGIFTVYKTHHNSKMKLKNEHEISITKDAVSVKHGHYIKSVLKYNDSN